MAGIGLVTGTGTYVPPGGVANAASNTSSNINTSTGTYNPANSWADPSSVAPTSTGTQATATANLNTTNTGNSTPTPSQQGQIQSNNAAITAANTPTQSNPGVNSTLQPKSATNQYGYPTTGYFSTPEAATAAANTALKNKYAGFVAAKGKSEAASTGSQASSAITSYSANLPVAPTLDPVTEAVAGAVTQYQTDVQNLNGFEGTMQSITSYQNQVSAQLGIPQLQAEDLNIKTVMSGSEDDIRAEITSAGGFATESQVEGLTATRNNVLVKQATNIENQLSIAQGNLSTAVSSFSGDQSNALNALKDKVNNDSATLSIYQGIQSNNTSNLNKLVSNVGYTALAKMLSTSDPTGASLTAAEGALGLPSGTLSNPTSLASLDTYREQTISQADTRLSETYGITPDQVNSLGGTDSGIKATDGGTFAQFPSMQAGIQAAQSLLMSSTYSGLSVEDAMRKWSFNSYGAEITKIPATATISSLSSTQLSQLINDMTAREGGNLAAGYRVNNPLDIKYVASSAPATGVTGSPIINTNSPGYTTAIVPNTGGNTQAAIDQAAMQYAISGTLPTGGRGGTGAALQFADAVRARAGEMDAGGNIQGNKAQLSALSTSLTAQTTYKNSIQQALTKAEGGFSQLMTAFSGSGIDPNESTVANASLNSITSNLTGGSIFAYKAGLAEISADYSQVFARNGQTSVATQNKAADILNGNISFSDLKQVQTELQAQGNTALTSATNQISTIQSGINSIISPGNTPAPTPDVSFANGTLNFNGQSIAVGGTMTGGGVTLTLLSDGNLSGSDGNTYQPDADGELQLVQ